MIMYRYFKNRCCENIFCVMFIIKMLFGRAQNVNWFVVDNLDRIIS